MNENHQLEIWETRREEKKIKAKYENMSEKGTERMRRKKCYGLRKVGIAGIYVVMAERCEYCTCRDCFNPASTPLCYVRKKSLCKGSFSCSTWSEVFLANFFCSFVIWILMNFLHVPPSAMKWLRMLFDVDCSQTLMIKRLVVLTRAILRHLIAHLRVNGRQAQISPSHLQSGEKEEERTLESFVQHDNLPDAIIRRFSEAPEILFI